MKNLSWNREHTELNIVNYRDPCRHPVNRIHDKQPMQCNGGGGKSLRQITSQQVSFIIGARGSGNQRTQDIVCVLKHLLKRLGFDPNCAASRNSFSKWTFLGTMRHLRGPFLAQGPDFDSGALFKLRGPAFRYGHFFMGSQRIYV